MYPQILHLFGPFSINSYGAMIALGIGVFMWRVSQHPWIQNHVSNDALSTIIGSSVLSGLIGGRIAFLAFHNTKQFDAWYELLYVWDGGLSILGVFVSVLITLPLTMRALGIPLFPGLDIGALYIPLMYSISRIGCFLAGCCHGYKTTVAWAVTYTHPLSQTALIGIPVHPTQLYSSVCLLLIFITLLFLKRFFYKQGQVLSMTLLLLLVERYSINFWRYDALSNTASSGYHTLNIFLICCATLFVIYTSYQKRHCRSYGSV